MCVTRDIHFISGVTWFIHERMDRGIFSSVTVILLVSSKQMAINRSKSQANEYSNTVFTWNSIVCHGAERLFGTPQKWRHNYETSRIAASCLSLSCFQVQEISRLKIRTIEWLIPICNKCYMKRSATRLNVALKRRGLKVMQWECMYSLLKMQSELT